MCTTICQSGRYSVQSFARGTAILITRNDGPGRVLSALLQGEEAGYLELELGACPEGREAELVLSAYDEVMVSEGPPGGAETAAIAELDDALAT
ncbi:hypothetical protein [Labrys wisconsinensis]|uniref:Uncharacterized protein n=1 Tax=Labrys wisconsinensis TaxID=425677 RepID=A0ABU0JLT0_9HYPH|nr:hypothetical protein [Labrys wisconsinensis]MDQ0475251.1 hypothetical protein [Labrys wisconsinensis]